MKVLQILQFVGLIAERIMFWKQSDKTSNNEHREEGKNGKLAFLFAPLARYKISIKALVLSEAK